MRLKFKCINVSHSRYDEIVKRIYDELNELNVDKIETTNNVISFKNTIWRFGSNTKAMIMVRKGKFEISAYENFVKVEYTYSVSILGDVLFILITFLLGTYEYILVYFLCLMFIMQLFIKLWKIRKLQKKVFGRIINS